ncbi:MAG: helix-turn-helix transcriptional regulator [Haloferacaceae archaeon]
MTDGERLREVLAHRHELLARLVEGRADKPTLVDDLPVARSTVDRGIRDLSEVGCVERVGGEFRASAAGRAALDAFERYADATDGVTAATCLLAHLPPDAALPPRVLVGADVRVADEHAPGRATVCVSRAAETADRVRATAPVLYSRYLDSLVTIVERGVEFEAVVARPVVESADEIDRERAERIRQSDSYDSYVTDADLPYAVMLAESDGDWTLFVIVYDAGAPRGVLVTDAEAAVEWGHEQYRAVRAEAEPLAAAETESR